MAGEVLKRGAAGEHESDHCTGEVFAEAECAAHGQRRQQVEADLAAYEAADHIDQENKQDRDGGDGKGQFSLRPAER